MSRISVHSVVMFAILLAIILIANALHSSEFQHHICSLRPQVGRCRARFVRWYYDPQQMDCLSFIYGGCGGNGNNFVSRKKCMIVCDPDYY